MFCQNDATRAGMETLARELSSDGVRTLIAGGSSTPVDELPTLAAESGHRADVIGAEFFYKGSGDFGDCAGIGSGSAAATEQVTRTC